MTKLSQERSVHIIDGYASKPHLDTGENIAHYIQAQTLALGKNSHLHLADETRAKRGAWGWSSEAQALTQNLIADPETQIIFFIPTADSAANASVIAELQATLRSQRKDLFLILASPTSGATPEDQYFTALNLMKSNHANLVLAYDEYTHTSMVVVPEEAYYGQSTNLKETLDWLIKIAVKRAGETFTRSQVIAGLLVSWASTEISQNFREVVDHLVDRGAYKRFRGKTAGHFAIRGRHEDEFLTSRRNSDFNKLSEIGLVRVIARGKDNVTAIGSKPSVGGQSQRKIFDQYRELANIVHFHSPLRANATHAIPVREQWPFECGSHQCGQNTADGLKEVAPGIYAVMLENHGPNIVFGNDVSASHVIDLIEHNFDLEAKTGYAPNERDQGRRLSERSAFNLDAV